MEDGEQSEEVENFTLLNADGSVEAVLDEKIDNLLITSEAKVKLRLTHFKGHRRFVIRGYNDII